MINKEKFFFFGFGQTAKYFLKELLNSKKDFSFCATNTKKTQNKSFKNKHFKSYKFNNKVFDKKIIEELLNADYILVSIPPQGKKEVVLNNFGKVLSTSKFKKIIYLSATSVYGNHNGKWVNENSELKGKTKFGLYRKIAEINSPKIIIDWLSGNRLLITRKGNKKIGNIHFNFSTKAM